MLALGDEALLNVSPATAFDAQGQRIPVDVRVTGHTLRYEVNTDGLDVAWPIAVDPYVAEDQRYWVSPNSQMDFTGWRPYSGGGTFGTAQTNLGYGRGLYLYSDSSKTYNNGSYVQWVFQAPYEAGQYEEEGARIFKADFGYTVHAPSTLGGCMAQSIYSRQQLRPEPYGTWRGPDPATAQSGYTFYDAVFGLRQCNAEGTATTAAKPNGYLSSPYRVHCLSYCGDTGGNPARASAGNAVALTLFQPPGKPSIGGVTFMGSSLIFMIEAYPPHPTVTAPTGWARAGNIDASAIDYGLGVASLDLRTGGISGPPVGQLPQPDCLKSTTYGNSNGGPATGSVNQGDRNRRCPRDSGPLQVSYDTLAEGAYDVLLTTKDVVGNAAYANVPVKIDRKPPEISFSGSLADRFGSSTAASSYGLHIDAVDRPNQAGVATSGTKSITISIDDGPVVAQTPSSCSTTTCEGLDYTFIPVNYTVGPHLVSVTAVDSAGNATTQAQRIKVVRPRPVGPVEHVDLFGSKLALRVQGAAAGDGVGTTVAQVGDVNGDGSNDFAVAAPAASPPPSAAAPLVPRSQAGITYIVYGSSSRGTIDLASLPATRGFRILGAAPLDGSGTAVASLGDVNGDGLPDIGVGAPRRLAGIGLLRGAVYVVFGREGTPADIDLAALGNDGFRIDGPTGDVALPTTGNFGTAIADSTTGSAASGGDFNGDGLDDVVIGDAAATPPANVTRVQGGSVFVVFGKADNAPVDVGALGALGTRIDGPGAQANFGASVAVVGDQNDDGGADLAIGAPGDNLAGRTNAGTVTVVFGDFEPGVTDAGALASGGGTVYRGDNGQKLGTGVTAIQDQNNDLTTDIGMSGAQPVVVFGGNPNSLVVDLAATPQAGWRILPPAGTPAGDVLTVLGSSDVDDDVVGDVLVRAVASPARYWVLYSHLAPATVDLANLSSADGYDVTSTGTPALSSVASAENTDGAFHAAQIAGIAAASPAGRTGAGEAYLVSGPPQVNCMAYATAPPPPDAEYVMCDKLGFSEYSSPATLRANVINGGTSNPYPWNVSHKKSVVYCRGKRGSNHCSMRNEGQVTPIQISVGAPPRLLDPMYFKLEADVFLGAYNRDGLRGRNGVRAATVSVSMNLKQAPEKGKRRSGKAMAARCRIDIEGADDFNCWDAIPLTKQAGGSTRAPLKLPPGRNAYAQRQFTGDQFRFIEFLFMAFVGGYPSTNPDNPDIPYARFDSAFSMQSSRFVCPEDVSIRSGVCRFSP